MDQEKGMNDPAADSIDVTKKKNLFQDKAEGLEKCLEENKGDYIKCKDKVEAFKSSSSSSSSTPPPTKPLTPIRLRSGSLIDV